MSSSITHSPFPHAHIYACQTVREANREGGDAIHCTALHGTVLSSSVLYMFFCICVCVCVWHTCCVEILHGMLTSSSHHPVPLLYLVSDGNKAWPHPAHTKFPLRFSPFNGEENDGSVPPLSTMTTQRKTEVSYIQTRERSVCSVKNKSSSRPRFMFRWSVFVGTLFVGKS